MKPTQDGAEQIARAIDKSIKQLQMLRDIVTNAGPALEGWHISGGDLLCGVLLQLHRVGLYSEPCDVDAKIAARALSPDWEDDDGGKWRAKVPGLPNYSIILHGADLSKKPSAKIEL